MKKSEKKEYNKDPLRIVVTFSGEYVHYGTDLNDPDYEDGRDLHADEIEEIEIFFPEEKEPIRLSEYLPPGVTFVHSPELGDGYHELNGCYISFDSLIEKGGLIGILHEMGHANVDERYNYLDESSNSNLIRERHAWGWALLLFKELKRQGKNLEPQMDEISIKDLIKDSLISHEICSRASDQIADKKVVEHGYWPKMRDEDLVRVVDELYDKPLSNLRDSYASSQELKRAVRLPKK